MSKKTKFIFEYILYILLIIVCCWFGSILIEKKNEQLLKNSIYNSLSQISQDWALVKVKGLRAIIEGNAPSKYDSIKIIRYLNRNYPFLIIENKTKYDNQVSFHDKITFIRLFKENENVFLIGHFPREGIKKITGLLVNRKIPIKILLSENTETFDPPLQNTTELLQSIIFMSGIVTAELTRNLISIKMSRQDKKNEQQLNKKITEFKKNNTYPKIEIQYFNKASTNSKIEKKPLKSRNNSISEKLPPKEKVYLVLEKKNKILELKGVVPEIIKANLISYLATKYPSVELLDNLTVSKSHNILITNAFIKSTNLIDIMKQFKLSLSANGLEVFGTTENEAKAKKIIDKVIAESKLKDKDNLVKIIKLRDSNKKSLNKKNECQNIMFNINNNDSITFTTKSFELKGDQVDYIESLVISLKKCLIFDPSMIGYGDRSLSPEHSSELGLARASSVYLKMLKIDPSIVGVDISGEIAKNIFKMEHNQQRNKKIPKIEVRFSE